MQLIFIVFSPINNKIRIETRELIDHAALHWIGWHSIVHIAELTLGSESIVRVIIVRCTRKTQTVGLCRQAEYVIATYRRKSVKNFIAVYLDESMRYFLNIIPVIKGSTRAQWVCMYFNRSINTIDKGYVWEELGVFEQAATINPPIIMTKVEFSNHWFHAKVLL